RATAGRHRHRHAAERARRDLERPRRSVIAAPAPHRTRRRAAAEWRRPAPGGGSMSLLATSDVLGADTIPRINICGFFNAIVDWIQAYLPGLLGFLKTLLKNLDSALAPALRAVPPLVLILSRAAIGFLLRGWQFALFTLIGMTIIVGMRFHGESMWSLAMDTLALVIIAGVVAMIFAVPLGVLAARSEAASKVIRPVLDFMQTLPAFVYLIPAIFFFSAGTTAGIIATIIFAMPPR